MIDKRPAAVRLSEALKEIGAHQMSDAAKDGYYDDFKSPLAMPISQLVTDLVYLATPAALDLRRRVIDGEFDAGKQESEAWAASPEGQAAIGKLAKGE